ncbi:MAG: GlsB/YeaQ/YmgE family stress response membrane protein [Egibacteraceae bacterium]
MSRSRNEPAATPHHRCHDRFLVVGLVIGALARLLLPGEQHT